MDINELTLVALEGSMGSSVSITLDVLRTANQIAEVMGHPTLSWQVIGSSRAVQTGNGMRLDAVPLSNTPSIDSSMLIISGLGLEGIPPLNSINTERNIQTSAHVLSMKLIARLSETDARILVKLVKDHHHRGLQTAASCSAVFLLGEAGILDGRTATTHWQLYETFRQRYPASVLDTKRMLVHDGNIMTAGAAMAQMDLILYIVRIRMGNQIAELTMRYLLIDGRPAQYLYMASSSTQMSRREISMLEKFIEDCMPNVPSLDSIAKHLMMTKKTLSRRVQDATGKSPMALIQSVRLRHVYNLLQTSHMSIEEIAFNVGYADSTALRRLIKKNMGCTPSQLRQSTPGPLLVGKS